MCSVGEDDFGDEGGAHAMTRDNIDEITCSIGSDILCKKCNKNLAAVKIAFRDPECQDCFLNNVRHKFRATLGSSKVLPKNSEVLILFDGSDASIVLTDMLHYAQTQNTFKRLHCTAKLLYIDEDFGHNLDLNEIEKFLGKYDFDSYIVSIGGNGDPINFKNILHYIEHPQRKLEEEKFQKEFENIKSLTSQQDYLERRRKAIIQRAANFLNIKFVFLADICSDLAVTLLTDVALGRGGSMSEDVSFIDTRYEGIKFIRPLKDLSVQEVESYLKFCNIDYSATNLHDPYGINLGPNSSIKNLTKDFIENLQNGFSSTVSTVYRVGDKLAGVQTNNKSNDINIEEKLKELNLSSFKCVFCNSNLDYFDTNTLLALEFTKLTSENANISSNIENLEYLEKKAWKNLYADDENNDKILKNLCHGCRNLYRDCGNFLFMQ